jgi:hypothetical protein
MPKEELGVPVPPGMNAEQVKKLWQTFLKQRVAGKQKDNAYRATVKRMKELHPAEWDKIYNEELAKQSGA